jgi:hypothetical protein
MNASEEFVREGCRPRPALDPGLAKRPLLHIKNASLEDAQEHSSILLMDASEPRSNALAAGWIHARVLPASAWPSATHIPLYAFLSFEGR